MSKPTTPREQRAILFAIEDQDGPSPYSLIPDYVEETDTINPRNFTLCEAAPDLLALAERVARLNPNCAEIGAGMLAQLHADAVAAIAKAKGDK